MEGRAEEGRKEETRGKRHLGPGGRLAPVLFPVLRRLGVNLGMAVETGSPAWMLVGQCVETANSVASQGLSSCLSNDRYSQPRGSKQPSFSAALGSGDWISL